MNALMKYLLRSKRGLTAAVGLPTVTLLAVLLLTNLSEMISDCFVDDYSTPLLYQFIEDLFGSTVHIETIVLIGMGFGFLILCANAFRFGTANGASRDSVIKVTTLSAVITAVITAIATLLFRLPRYYYCTANNDYMCDETLYTRFFFRSHVRSWDEEMDMFKPIVGENERLISGGEMIMRQTVMFFLFALIVLLSIAAIYALYRRAGLFGALCGVLGVMTCTAVIVLLRQFPDSLGVLFFDASHSDVCGNYVMISPRTLPLLILVIMMTGTAGLVFIKAIKRAGIKPQSL